MHVCMYVWLVYKSKISYQIFVLYAMPTICPYLYTNIHTYVGIYIYLSMYWCFGAKWWIMLNGNFYIRNNNYLYTYICIYLHVLNMYMCMDTFPYFCINQNKRKVGIIRFSSESYPLRSPMSFVNLFYIQRFI